jgi:hypothetical protein
MIIVVGCDMVGAHDAAGVKGEDRSDDRWYRERRDVRMIADYLREERGRSVLFLSKTPGDSPWKN